MNLKKTIFISALAMLSQEVHADLSDGRELYDLAPEGAAFIRQIDTTASCEVSDIRWIEAGANIPGSETGAQSGRLYTIVKRESGSSLMTQAGQPDPFKAMLALVNVSNEDGSLVTTTGARAVFKDVASETRQERALNPITVALTVNFEDQELPLAPVVLSRGQVTEVIVCDHQSYAISTY